MFRYMPADGMRTRLVLRLLPVALCVALVALAGGTSVALELAPAALLVLPLLLGRYPGERVIRRLAGGDDASPRAACCIFLARAPRSLGVRAATLAVPGAGRAPPAAALV